jgi:hypothetical protein
MNAAKTLSPERVPSITAEQLAKMAMEIVRSWHRGPLQERLAEAFRPFCDAPKPDGQVPEVQQLFSEIAAMSKRIEMEHLRDYAARLPQELAQRDNAVRQISTSPFSLRFSQASLDPRLGLAAWQDEQQ